jgi:hypothetical protein
MRSALCSTLTPIMDLIEQFHIMNSLSLSDGLLLRQLLATLEFSQSYRVYFHNLFILWQILFLSSENPCLFASPAFEVTLSGLAGGENTYPFQPLKGWLSPSCSPSMGTPPLQQFTLKDNGFLRRVRKLQLANRLNLFQDSNMIPILQ